MLNGVHMHSYIVLNVFEYDAELKCRCNCQWSLQHQAVNTVMCECRVGVVQQPAMQQILQHQPELAHKLLFELASLDLERKQGALPDLALHMPVRLQLILVPSQPCNYI
jgi:hypothetical protein